MAGGTFTQTNKKRPGAYINIKAPTTAVPSADTTRGVVFFVGGNYLGWGATGIVTLNSASDFQKLLGVDLTSDLPGLTVNPTQGGAEISVDQKQIAMLHGLRETIKAASKVLFYNINTGEKAALAENAWPWVFTAKYPGERGNTIQVGVAKDASVDGQFIVTTYFGTVAVDRQTVTAASQLLSNDYVDVTVSADGSIDDGAALLDAFDAASTKSLTGGTTDTSADIDTDSLIASMEVQEFNTVVAAGQEPTATIHALIASTVERLRDDEGQKVTAVIPDGTTVDADYEGLIVVANGVTLEDGTVLSASEAAGWVAGAEAAAAVNQSLTYAEYPNAIDVTPRYDDESTIAGLNAGKLMFTVRRDGTVVIEQDINSLHTFTSDKSSSLSKNRVMRVLDELAQNTKDTFESSFIGKINNDTTGRDLFKANRIQYINTLVNSGAVQAFDNDDITVDPGDELDQVIVTLGVQPIDAMEKLYMTVTI
ncbi:phage tail sheath subtilisin-like domain-containing protein [Lacticaseibacillus hulanensis]|uniref:phage tail sheath subtilisin-like domain-containing protein n=1 Tax=Lacticaseibacillus hulanensis TaxID=2493111 RepID=UPI000FDAAC29|nr:phage tail sheath subtilisin-like domain-containing protein [Lacticaseibacillus hulanensis]